MLRTISIKAAVPDTDFSSDRLCSLGAGSVVLEVFASQISSTSSSTLFPWLEACPPVLPIVCFAVGCTLTGDPGVSFSPVLFLAVFRIPLLGIQTDNSCMRQSCHCKKVFSQMPHQYLGPTVFTELSNLRTFFIPLKGLFSLNFVNFLAMYSMIVASCLEEKIFLILGFVDSDLQGVGGGGGGSRLDLEKNCPCYGQLWHYL